MAVDEVSVRELRQNLSVHLRRVQAGDTLAVTNRGQRVAVLAPLAGGSRVDRLIAEGRITAPSAPPGPIATPPDEAADRPLTQALLAMRREDAR